MSSDCLDAQQILSMTNDGEQVGAEALRTARAHCATCSTCASFEASLKAMRRQRPAPLADDLVARVMSAVDAEAAAEQARRVAAASHDVATLTPATTADTPPEGPRVPSGIVLPRTRRDWTLWGGWIAAAAMLLVVAGIAAVRGAYFIAAPPSAQSDSALRYSNSADVATEGEASLGWTAEDAKGTVTPTQATDDYVTFNGWVYVSTGTAGPLASNAATIGVVTSALNTGGSVLEMAAFRGSTKTSLVLQGADDSLLGFELVSRTFQGTPYGLRSGPIEQFGQWPTLPTGIPQPDNADGSPTFERSIADDTGVAIYRRTGQSESSGFAVAPGTSASDPAAGNPNWTWWEPFK